MSDLIESPSAWFNATIAGSSVWSAIGLLTACLIGIYLFWLLVKAGRFFVRTISNHFAARRRKSQQGYGISVAPFTGPGGGRQTRALIKALDNHLGKFSFGAPYEVIKAPRLRARGAKGLRVAATKWLETSATDLIIWGHRRRGAKENTRVEVLSCEGSLSPEEATHSSGMLPMRSAQNSETVDIVNGYLIARALLPGLANATAYKAERIAPVAETLLRCLEDRDALPERTQLTLEMDYCAMALHLAEPHHLDNVVKFRRSRLASAQGNNAGMPVEIEIQSRVDLGRALLKTSALQFDPVLVREAVDELKTAIDLLKTNPILQLASVTSASVQQGQSLLANRKRFSVTGGANL